MAGVISQVPRIDYPGLEYFSSVPGVGGQLAIGSRLSASGNSTTAAVAGGGTATVTGSALLDPVFTLSSGIFLHSGWGQFVPLDGTAELQIVSIRLGFAVGPPGTANIVEDLGVPLLTLISPASSMMAIRERDYLFCGKDLVNFGQATPQALFLDSVISVKNNDPTNPHSFFTAAVAKFTRLSGLGQ